MTAKIHGNSLLIFCLMSDNIIPQTKGGQNSVNVPNNLIPPPKYVGLHKIYHRS